MHNFSENENRSLKAADIRSISLLSKDDIYLFNEGNHFRLYRKLGAHVVEKDGIKGTYFAVWAPNARKVGVIGDFNDWNKGSHPLKPIEQSGIWEGFIPDISQGIKYKYHIISRYKKYEVDKADPLAFHAEKSSQTASIVWDMTYQWNDNEWMQNRKVTNSLKAPISIYELHIGSWMRNEKDGNRPLTYRELAPILSEYIIKTGFTHIELMPVMEHPFTGSWGYQITGFFAATSRFGTPQDLMYMIDYLHRNGIGVILDWVPSHFPNDEHGLAFFDGTHLYEHEDPRKGFHPDWDSLIFNYGRNEVRSFLLSSAVYWLDNYHVDGLRIDAVASMLYLDYSRKNGEWIPNKYGGRENLEAILFLKHLNEIVYREYPDVQTIAEESTSWPSVSKPTYLGGLGFGMKWDMGWMHDTLKYLSFDPIFRKYHHDELTFRSLYYHSENFVLPLSHDEVVYGKGSLISKMPGSYDEKFANLRLLLGYMYALPGKKLLFMGGEIGQWNEWNHDSTLDWHLLNFPSHSNLQKWVTDLNLLYRTENALSEKDFSADGFRWIDAADFESSIISFLRSGSKENDSILIVCNFTPVPRFNYRTGAPYEGEWKELLNSDALEYGGSGIGNMGKVEALPNEFHGRPYSLNLTLPPLSILFLKNDHTLK
jgi:1,4-alpha-glucan branching enzyme